MNITVKKYLEDPNTQPPTLMQVLQFGQISLAHIIFKSALIVHTVFKNVLLNLYFEVNLEQSSPLQYNIFYLPS